MRVVFDIDNTLNNLNETINNKYNLVESIEEINRYRLRDTNLSESIKKAFKEACLEDIHYSASVSVVNKDLMNLFLELNKGGSTIYYTKCLIESHIDTKRKWLLSNYNIESMSSYSIADFKKKDLCNGIYYVTAIGDKICCDNVDIVVEDCVDNLLGYGDNVKKILIKQPWNEFEYNEIKDQVSNLVRVDSIDECLEYLIRILISCKGTYELNISVESGSELDTLNLKGLAVDINRTLESISDYNVVMLDGDTALCLGNMYLDVVDTKLIAKTDIKYIARGEVLNLYDDIQSIQLQVLDVIMSEICTMYIQTAKGLELVMECRLV